MFKEILQIYDSLADKESRTIFEQRLLYNLTGNIDYFFEQLYLSEERDKNFQYLSDFYQRKSVNGKKIILFGAKGPHPGAALDIVRRKGFEVYAFSDNNPSLWNETLFDIPIISPDKLRKHYKDCIVLITIGNKFSENEVYDQLCEMGLDKADIYKMISWWEGPEYFERFMTPPKHGVYVDAGTFDGANIAEYCDWCNGDYEKIYAFELSKANYKLIQKNIEELNLKNVEIYNYGLWNKRGKLSFSENRDASTITDGGDSEADVISLDEVLAGEKVSFIKMDIEGAELEALHGAEKSIKAHMPQMAICIYHKPEDIIDIPLYIKELLPDCKMYIRHKNHYFFDTILYVVP